MRDRRSFFCIAAALVAAALLTGGILYHRECVAKEQVDRLQKHLAEEVFRFHVLANSDSEEDQAVKLQVKDAVVTYMKKYLTDAADARETKKWCQEHLSEITEVAEEVLRREGFSDPVRAQVTKCDFPDKSYGDITFPAGTYDALRIQIGEAKGHNWWCVLYPDLCFIDAVHAVVPEEGKEKLKNVLTDEEYDMVTAMKSFRVKWFFFGNENEG